MKRGFFKRARVRSASSSIRVQRNRGGNAPAGSRLTKAQAVASIGASVAIPLILAIFGYLVQRQLSTDGIKKDYVQIATVILKESPESQDPELRKWAVDILDSNSSIPFSPAAKKALQGNIPLVRTELIFFEPPQDCMRPPQKSKLENLIKSAIKPEYIRIDDPRKFLNKMADEDHAARYNAASLECLQKYVQIVKSTVNKFNAQAYGLSPSGFPEQASSTPKR